MALCRLPNPASLAYRDRKLSPSASKSSESRLGWITQQSPSCRALLLVCAATNSRSCRKSRASKSNAEICDELREFILVSGLPEHHVPSTKELLEHGRKDLANIVRRRGHRVIAKLLANPPNGEITPATASTESNLSRRISVEQSVEDLEAQELQCSMAGESPSEVMTGFNQNGALENNRGADPQLSISSQKHQYSISEDTVPAGILEDFRENSSSDLAETEEEEEEEEDQTKIDHLRELLRKKETELSLLKQQLEVEKLALSAMQSKVQSELSKVEEIISSKDEELLSAEESLSGLQEILLEYWGNAETVEVTGSFNGWQHKLVMDPQMPSNTVNPAGARESTMWSTVLWLYPGVYEIKFIVDGHWKIDPQREFISRDNIVNNILRVDGDDPTRSHAV